MTVIRECKVCGWSWRQAKDEKPACPRCAKTSAGDS